MKKTEQSTVSQYCLDAIPVDKFVESMPKAIKIYELSFRGCNRGSMKKLLIPEYIKKMGVNRAVSKTDDMDVSGLFTNSMKHDTMVKNIKRIAQSYHIPVNKFHVRRVVLMDKDNTCSLSFRRMYKQIKLPNDKRRKKIVIGHVGSDGKQSAAHDLLAKISAKKIVCTLAKTEKTIVMCSEEIVTKGGK